MKLCSLSLGSPPAVWSRVGWGLGTRFEGCILPPSCLIFYSEVFSRLSRSVDPACQGVKIWMSDLGALGAGWLLVLIHMGWNPHIAVIWMWNLSSLPQ